MKPYEPVPRRILSLARRPRLRQLLCSLQGGQEVGVGSLFVGGFFSWIICPVILASLLTNDLFGVLKQQTMGTLWWTYFFGAMWGFGGLTFGLTMRYLGMSLGMGVALHYCAAFGTLIPPIFKTFIPSIPVAETIGQIAKGASR